MVADKYAVDTTFGVKHFETNQICLMKSLLDEANQRFKNLFTKHEVAKKNKDRELSPKKKTLNKFIPFRDNMAIKLIVRDISRQVV